MRSRAAACGLAVALLLVAGAGCGLEDKIKDPVVREVEVDVGG